MHTHSLVVTLLVIVYSIVVIVDEPLICSSGSK